jgi:p-hydroxybenzoate 3-monooxygenase
VSELAGGRAFTIYGQERLVADLVDARLETGRPLLFEAEALGVDGALTERPVVRYRHEGAEHELACALVAGCDGFHGASRRAIPDGVLRTLVRDYGTGWLGVLVDGQPSTQEPIWCHSEHGFVLCTVRGAERSRMFLQCGPHDDPADWPQERIWRELGARLAAEDGWALQRGDILNVTPAIPFRSFVAEPMQYGRLYLAGDAAHIVPPLGAKGLNLAVGDIRVLSEAMTTYFESGETALLESYSRTCLERVWRVQRFSSWATRTFHRFPDDEPFQKRVQRAELEYLASSEAAARTFAESFVGLHRSPMAAGAQPGSAL